MRRKRAIALSAAGVVVVAAVGATTAVAATTIFGHKHTSHRTFAADIRAVVVDGSTGDVRVTAAGDSDARVKATTSWLLSKPKVHEYVRDGVLHLESHTRHGLLAEADFDVRVRAGVSVTVDQTIGDVRVAGKPRDVRVDTTAGDVHVDVARAPRSIDIDASAGDVHVAVPAGVYAVDTHAGAGDETVRGLVRYDLGKRTITVRTGAGDITVERR